MSGNGVPRDTVRATTSTGTIVRPPRSGSVR